MTNGQWFMIGLALAWLPAIVILCSIVYGAAMPLNPAMARRRDRQAAIVLAGVAAVMLLATLAAMVVCGLRL